MGKIIFYEKPGCKGNTRQRALLESHGYSLDVRSILDEPWTYQTLRPFFGDLPVSDWFNDKAPAIRAGQIDPSTFDESLAIALMLSEPILIRRPLMDWDGRKFCGFDASIEAMFELCAMEGNLESCMEPTGRCD